MHTLENITSEILKVFTICDAKDGFIQVCLEEESLRYTTFSLPFGHCRWIQMPFDCQHLKNFNKELLKLLNNYLDCIIVGAGDTKKEAIRDHGCNLRKFLDRC